jgi:hypothetical protein
MEAVRFADPTPLGRLAQLLDLEKRMLAARQQQALATYMVAVLETYDGDPAALLPFAPRLAATRLPPSAKQAVLQRLPQPAAADRS